MDAALFGFVNGLAGRWPLLDQVGVLLAKYGISLAVVAVVVLALRMHDLRRSVVACVQIAIAGFLSLALAYLIAYSVNRPRPFIVEHVRQLLPHAPDPSWPSEHATALAAVAGVMILLDTSVGIGMFVVALLIGVARVFVGVHYPADVLGGLALGSGVGLAVGWAYLRFMPHGSKRQAS